MDTDGHGGATPAAATPRLSATVVLLRDGAAGPEVFMVVRHHEIDFASGALVFPGGRLETADALLAADPARCPPLPGVDGPAMALRVAAIRETFEECGVLLARPAGSTALIGSERLGAIAAAVPLGQQVDAAAFADLLQTQDLVLAPDLLTPFAHWITPVTHRKRYDTLFLMARAPADQLGVHDGHEAVDSVWITPAEAVAQAASGRYKLVFATLMNLRKLAHHADVAAALAAARAAPLVTVMPEAIGGPNGSRQLRLPEAAGYGGELFPADAPPVI